MKKLQSIFKGLLVGALLITLSPFSSEASHYSAGELFYQWIGNEPNRKPNEYRVFASIYGNTSPGTASPRKFDLNGCAFRSSSPGSAINFTLQYLDPALPLPPEARGGTFNNPYGWLPGRADPNDTDGWEIPNFDQCADPQNTIAEWRYMATVDLGRTAADWNFAISTPCCRDGSTNLNGGANLYLEVSLNNTLGQNSSPRIIGPAAKAFCVVQPGQMPFDWSQLAAETDGDSIRYGFDPSGSQQGNCGSPTQIPFDGGNTASDPFPSNPRVTINQNLGIFTMSPSQAGSYVIKFEAEELRFDTNSRQFLVVGNTVREVKIEVAGVCKPKTSQGPQIDVSLPDVTLRNFSSARRDSMERVYRAATIWGQDSINNGTTHQIPFYSGYDCFDNELILDFDVPVRCNTITPTDFRLVGDDGIARPITRVQSVCNTLGVINASRLRLELFKPLDRNGLYLLQIRVGNDGNTLENECGFALNNFYSALIEVDDCPIPEYSINNVTVNKDQHPEIFWEVNDSTSKYFTSDTNTPKFFNYWSILRRDHDKKASPMVEAGRLDSFAGRSFVDSFDQTWPVDLVIYDYQVVLVTNNDPKEATDTCNTIRLQDSLAADVSQLQLFWNQYNCWDSTAITEYSVYDAKIDTADTTGGAPNWQLVADVGIDTNFLYQKPPQDSLNQGLYSVKVESQSPDDSTLISESNWIFYRLVYDPDTTPPPPDIPELGTAVIPNIITPNGDNINDRFYVSFVPEGSRSFERISVKIFNRWGQLVFEDANFHERNTFEEGWAGTDMNNGNSLGNGVYYYLINLNDPTTGETDSREGHITITGANASR